MMHGPFFSPEQLRAERRRAQRAAGGCKKHPGTPARRFDVYRPNHRWVRHEWLCIDCARVLVSLGAKLG